MEELTTRRRDGALLVMDDGSRLELNLVAHSYEEAGKTCWQLLGMLVGCYAHKDKVDVHLVFR